MIEDDPERRLDATGRPQYIRKSTQVEIDRRSGLVMKLYRRGHTVQEISVALNVSDDVVAGVLRRLMPNRPRRLNGRGRIIEPCPWRDEDLPAEQRETYVSPEARESRWRQSRIVGMAQMLNDEFRETNFANILANQATDAETAGDRPWALEALATFTAAIEKLERARRVLTDDRYRAACRDTLEGVEQMRRKITLRAVPDDR